MIRRIQRSLIRFLLYNGFMIQQIKDNEVVPCAKKIKTDSVVSKMEKTPRSVKITVSKGDIEEKDLCSCLTISIMTAMRELGVGLDITIREKDDSYEVILEE